MQKIIEVYISGVIVEEYAKTYKEVKAKYPQADKFVLCLYDNGIFIKQAEIINDDYYTAYDLIVN
jgi:hypothetical protein